VTFSPDGRHIAFASDRAGNADIWRQDLARGAVVQLTQSPSDETEPDWSPDGRTIVFRSSGVTSGVFTIPADGGAQRKISDFGTRPQWSPDGSRILLWVDGASSSEPPALYVVGASGTPVSGVSKFDSCGGRKSDSRQHGQAAG